MYGFDGGGRGVLSKRAHGLCSSILSMVVAIHKGKLVSGSRPLHLLLQLLVITIAHSWPAYADNLKLFARLKPNSPRHLVDRPNRLTLAHAVTAI